MLTLAVAALASSVVTPTAAPPVASAAPQETVSAQIERGIDEHLAYPIVSQRRNETGMVQVSFRLDREGRPTRIKVAKRTQWKRLNNAAVETIRQIGPIQGGDPATKYVALLQFSTAGREDELGVQAAWMRAAFARAAKNRRTEVASRQPL